MTAIELILEQLTAATQRGEDKRVLLQLVEELRMAVLDMPLILKPEILEKLEAPPRRALAVQSEEGVGLTTMPSAVVSGQAPTPVQASRPLRAPVPPRRVVAAEEEGPVVAPVAAPVPVPVADQFVAAQLSKMPVEHQAFVPSVSAVPEMLELPLTDEILEEASAVTKSAIPVVDAIVPVRPAAAPMKMEEKQPGLAVGKRAELNEVLASKPAASLNERFSQAAPAVAEAIASPRIADLRKAISVAEKFQYVNELFRQDESLFERSIKTINGFNIYAEAEYWMRRELATRLGWDEKAESAQQFYALVRRRFA